MGVQVTGRGVFSPLPYEVGGVEQVAVVVEGVDVHEAHPDLLAGNDAQLLHVDHAGLADTAVHHTGQLDGVLAGRPGLEGGVGHGDELGARGEHSDVGGVPKGGPGDDLHTRDDLGLPELHPGGSVGRLDAVGLDLDLPDVGDPATVLPLAVGEQVHDVVALDLGHNLVAHSDPSWAGLE